MINLESSTVIGGHLTMMQSGGEFDQSPVFKRYNNHNILLIHFYSEVFYKHF